MCRAGVKRILAGNARDQEENIPRGRRKSKSTLETERSGKFLHERVLLWAEA